MPSPNALGDTLEEDVAGELQATAPLCSPCQVSVPGHGIAQKARQPQRGAGARCLHRQGETLKDTLGSWMKRASLLGCLVCCVRDLY